WPWHCFYSEDFTKYELRNPWWRKGSTNYESRRSNSARVSRCIEIGAGLPLQEQDLPSHEFQFTRLRSEVNPPITYCYVSRFFHLERQDSLFLTPPTAWRKRQFSRWANWLSQCKP